MMSSIPDALPASRRALRQRLLARREQFAASPATGPASAALARRLLALLDRLAPRCLGVYVPVRSEFNLSLALDPAHGGSPARAAWPLALPYCRRDPREMHYRAWDGRALEATDECRIPASDGPVVVPDVVLAPCVGFTPGGYRLGYGGGYFDRWLAAHPQAIAVGVAWSASAIDEAELAPRAHDIALAHVVTEDGVFSRAA